MTKQPDGIFNVAGDFNRNTSELFYLNSTCMSRSPGEEETSMTICIQIFVTANKALPCPYFALSDNISLSKIDTF